MILPEPLTEDLMHIDIFGNVRTLAGSFDLGWVIVFIIVFIA